MTFTTTQLQTIDKVWQFYCRTFATPVTEFHIQLGGRSITKFYDDACSSQAYSVAFSVAENGVEAYDMDDWEGWELDGFTAWLQDTETL